MHIMSRQYRAATLLAASLGLLLGGCSSSNLSLTKRIDYKSASSTSVARTAAGPHHAAL